MSYQNTPALNFDLFDVACISGQNGVGKSTIFEALTYAIWGRSRANSDDELINQGQKKMYVELIFDHDGKVYKIARTRELKSKNRGISSLEFMVCANKSARNLLGESEKNWRSLTEGTIKLTQQKIIDVIKLPYEIFVNSSYLRQGHADEFTTKPAQERKEILADILELARYDRLAEIARDKHRQLKAKDEVTNVQLNSLIDNLEDEKEYRRKFKKLSTEKSQLMAQIEKLNQQFLKIEQKKNQIEIYRSKIQELQELLDDNQIEEQDLQQEVQNALQIIDKQKLFIKNKDLINQKYQEKINLDNNLRELNQKYRDYSIQKNEGGKIKALADNLKQQIERLRHIKTCPTCLRKLTPEEARIITSSLTSEFKHQYQPKINQIKKAIEKIAYDDRARIAIENKLENLKTINDEKQKLDEAQNVIKTQSILKDNYQTKIAKLSISDKTLRQRIKKGDDLIKNASVVDEKYAKIKSQIQNIQNRREVIMAESASYDEKLKQIEKQKDLIKNLQQESIKMGENIKILDILSQAFSKKGVQSLIIDQTIPMLEVEANIILEKISQGMMQVSFTTKRAKKSAKNDDEYIETLDINIADGLGVRPYEMFSGGEAFRINFAIRVALSKLLSMKAGTKLRFLIIDEGFGALDANGRDDLVASINSIKEDFEKILIISHIEELKDIFPNRIYVEKNENGSYFKMVE